MEVDMRIMIMKYGKHVMEGSSCEYANKTIRSKFFKNRLKLVLVSKAFINDVVANSHYLQEKDVKKIKIPLIQIMGFETRLTILSVKDEGVFAVEDLFKFSFPTTKSKSEKGPSTI